MKAIKGIFPEQNGANIHSIFFFERLIQTQNHEYFT